MPAPLVSGNHATKYRVLFLTKKGRCPTCARGFTARVSSYRTTQAAYFRERIRSIALAAVWAAGWKTTCPWARMDLTLWNSRIDRDNMNKTVGDALQGICFPFDSRVLDGNLRKDWDSGKERVEVVVTEINPADHGR